MGESGGGGVEERDIQLEEFVSNGVEESPLSETWQRRKVSQLLSLPL